MQEVFDLATRKGSELVVNSDMTAEVQSLSTQLYYMLVMMFNGQGLEICTELSGGHWCRSVAQVPLGIRAGCWYQIRSDVAISAEATIW